MTNDKMTKDDFEEFNSANLANAIQRAFPFLSQDSQHLQQELDSFVFPRLDFMAGDKNAHLFFVFEEHYVETEWKDMVSIHYINTSYKVENTVMRIHLFMKKEMCENCYNGCFTMRTINETHIMLSYIYPNWRLLNYKNKPLNVMTYRKKVHIKGYEIEFHTYPLFAQDNAVVSCAQACLVSMSKYLHSQYDYNKINIGNINNSYHSNKTKVYPSQGLFSTQMLEILYSYNIPCGFQIYNGSEDFKEYIDYCVESAVPVLVGLNVKEEENKETKKVGRHVIQIIGHTNAAKGKTYVVYDDSGYYLRYLNKNGFVDCVSWDVLCKSLQQDKSFIIYPIHEKVYILYDNFKKHMNDMMDKLNIKEILTDKDKGNGRRIMLIDNREVKKFLCEHMADSEEVNSEMQEEARRLLDIDMPHYLWCCEYSTSIGNLLFIANPTYNRRTTKNIFINKIPLICKSQIGLLRYNLIGVENRQFCLEK